MDLFLLTASLLAIAAIVSTRFAQRFGVPALVLFVVIGMLAGSSGPGGIAFSNYALSFNVGMLALAVILLSGGLDTRMRLFRAALLPAGLLATVGVVLKMLVVGLAAYAITPLSFLEGLLLGAVLAPTDAAAVFSVLKGKGLPTRLRGVLEAESGTNDPVSIYLTLTLSAVILAGGRADWGQLALGVALQLVLGGVLGYAFGRLLVWGINRVSIESFGLYPVLALAGGLFAYAASNVLGGNGFLTIYIVGLILGNRPLAHRQNIAYFMDGAAWGAQISMFLLLGLLVFPDRLLPSVPAALGITLVLIFVARPLSVYLTLEPLRLITQHYRFTLPELGLLSWAGLKGAVPIILAIVPLLNQMASGELIFNIVFVVVIVSTLVQGFTVAPLAKRLGLSRPEPPAPPLRVELGGAAPPGSAVFDVYLEGSARAVGQPLHALELPAGIVIAVIYRGGKLITPRGGVVFEAGDHVFVISSEAERGGVPAVFRREPGLKG